MMRLESQSKYECLTTLVVQYNYGEDLPSGFRGGQNACGIYERGHVYARNYELGPVILLDIGKTQFEIASTGESGDN